MKVKEVQHHELELEHYTGSLDFDCDFCGHNAYDNFHLSKDGQLVFVVCQDCLNKASSEGE